MKVVAHAHRPEEIRVGLKIGVDNFEHTGLTTAPGYPQDILDALAERAAVGIFSGLLFWTPTVEGLWNYEQLVMNPTALDDRCWERGLQRDTIADIRQSISEPARLGYKQLTPLRRPTLRNKFEQLRQTGVVLMVGTDSGIPTSFHCQSTWREMSVWVDDFGVDAQTTIRAATYWPAVMMGVQKDYGSIEPDKYADIIAVRGDVLRYVSLLQRVDFVMKHGVIYKQDGRVDNSKLPERFH
jgi:imidazolonepropionase-like amidohydrolase